MFICLAILFLGGVILFLISGQKVIKYMVLKFNIDRNNYERRLCLG
jgi:hypothetical protein